MSADREERLAAVAEAAERIVREGDDPDPTSLADEFGVPPEDARRCVAAVRAMADALENGLPDDDAALPPPDLPDDYEILGELGRGGMGVVYRARQRSLGRTVAVKVVRPASLGFADAVRRFKREAQSLAKLRHPGIVAVHDAGVAGDAVYYSMDVVEGGSLADRLREGRLHPGEAVRTLVHVASAVAHSHGRGIVHRDLKPANVLLDGDGNACVADFGLARDVALSLDASGSSRLIGTPGYMAPEQARGDAAAVGERTDVYALGVLLYECLTGRAPFAGRSLSETIQAVIHDPPRPPRRANPLVPKDLEAICLKAMAKRPERRYATARAFLEDLCAFAEGRPVRARTPRRIARAARFVGRHRAPFAAALVAALLVGALALFVLGPRLGRSPETLAALAEEMAAAGETRAAERLFAEAAEQYEFEGPVIREIRGSVRDELAWKIETGLADARVALAREKLLTGDREEARTELEAIGARTEEVFGEVGWPGRPVYEWCRILLSISSDDMPQASRRWDEMESWFYQFTVHPRAGEDARSRAAPATGQAETLVGLVIRDLDAQDPAIRRAAARWTLSRLLPWPEYGEVVRGRFVLEPKRFPERLANLVTALAEGEGAMGWYVLDAALSVSRQGLLRDVSDALAAAAEQEGRSAEFVARAVGVLGALHALPGCYHPGTEPANADEALAILALWHETKDLAYEGALRHRLDFERRMAGSWKGPRHSAGWASRHFGEPEPDLAGRTVTEAVAESLGFDGVPSPKAVLAGLRGAHRSERYRYHVLLRLVAPEETRIPLFVPSRSEPPGGLVQAWREALQLGADAGVRLVRVAHFRVRDAGPPELRWEETRELRIGEPWSLEHVEEVEPEVGATLWPPGLGTPTVEPAPGRRAFRTTLVLRWGEDGLGLEAGGWVDESRWPGGSGSSSWSRSSDRIPVGLVLPVDSMLGYSGYRDGRVENRFTLAVAEEPGADPGPWSVDDWRAQVARDLAFLADGLEEEGPREVPPSHRPFFFRYQQGIWSTPVVAGKLGVPSAAGSLARLAAVQDPGRGYSWEWLRVARLLAGDIGAVEDPVERSRATSVLHDDGLASIWPAVRMLLTTEEPAMREFALEAIRDAELTAPVRARIERAIGEGRLDAPDWLRERVDGAGREAFLDVLGPLTPVLAGGLGAALIGLLSVVLVARAGRRAVRRLHGASGLVLAGTMLVTVNVWTLGTNWFPDAVGFALAAAGVLCFRRFAGARPWRLAFFGFLVAFAARVALSAGAPAAAGLAVAGFGTAVAILALPYLARSVDPRGRRPHFLLFHLFYTLPMALLWGAAFVNLLAGTPDWRLTLDETVATLLLVAFGVAVLSAHLRLIGAARARARQAA